MRCLMPGILFSLTRIPYGQTTVCKRLHSGTGTICQRFHSGAGNMFVKDSLIRRQRIVDSLQFLQKELQYLLEAYSKSIREDIIIRCEPVPIIGDSVLGAFTYHTLPFGVRDPYCPWKTNLYLTGRPIRILVDEKSRKIQSIHTSQFKTSFSYAPGGIVVIHQPAVVQKNSFGHFYKNPVDSVFFDRNKRIFQIKSYVLFYAVNTGNQRGNLLFTNRTLVKQYDYDTNNEIKQYRMIRYCERWKVYESNKVCSIMKYDFSRQGTTWLLKRKNDPANNYSDGTYTFKFDNKENLSGISFTSLNNTGNWERTIEINKEGYVNCYFDKSDNRIIQSLCMIYHDEPLAKFPVETITTTFEKDGISYLQVNNSTGKSRTRDRMTLEWSHWK